MSKRKNCCCCCTNLPVCYSNSGCNGRCMCNLGGAYNQTCFGNICNPFCLVVLLLALKKGGIIQDQCTIEALFFIFLLLCCCGSCRGNAVGGCGCNRICSCC